MRVVVREVSSQVRGKWSPSFLYSQEYQPRVEMLSAFRYALIRYGHFFCFYVVFNTSDELLTPQREVEYEQV